MRLTRDDSMILAQLVETLGTIVVCAREKPDLTAMVEQLLLFFATLRSHRDVVVRRAVLQQTLLFVHIAFFLPHPLLRFHTAGNRTVELLSTLQAKELFDILHEWTLWLCGLCFLLFCHLRRSFFHPWDDVTTEEMENDPDDVCRALAQGTAATIQKGLSSTQTS